MKVITLKQPWATMIAEGLKEYEFRSWKTNYRGKLLIHAGKGIDKEAFLKFKNFNFEYPTEQVVAIVELEDCIKIDEEFNKMIKNKKNIVYGTKNRSGFAWKLKDIKKINNKKNIKGNLGLWNIDESFLDE